MKRVGVLLAVVVMAVLAPAPIIHRVPGEHPKRELSEDQMAQAQTMAANALALQSKSPQPEAPVVPVPQVAPVVANLDAHNALIDQQNAAKVLVVAEKRIVHEAPSPWKVALYGIGFLVFGGALAYGVKTYADKVVPPGPKDGPSRE